MNSLQVDTNMSYCPTNLTVNQPLMIVNKSQDQLAFKIKTNQKNLLSMNVNHAFIKPLSTLAIPVKIVQKVDENISIKLEINWCKATAQMKQKNDSKMQSVSKDQIHKKVFSIMRKQQKATAQNAVKSSTLSNPQSSLYESVHLRNSQQNSQKITPFQYDRITQPTSQKLPQAPKKQQLGYDDDIKQQQFQSQHIKNKEQQSLNLNSSIQQHLPQKNLEIVSQEDQEDHEKQLQQTRIQQIEERRRTDEIQSKIRRVRSEIKSAQIIDINSLLFLLIAVFVLGHFIKNLF